MDRIGQNVFWSKQRGLESLSDQMRFSSESGRDGSGFLLEQVGLDRIIIGLGSLDQNPLGAGQGIKQV